MRKITLLGSSGSIGQNTLRVLEKYPDDFELFAMAVHSNIEALERDLKIFSPKMVVIYDPIEAEKFQARHKSLQVLSGLEGLLEISSHPSVDFVMQAMSGSLGLLPTIHALQAGKTVGLANKESIIMGGEILLKTWKESEGTLIPVDSEHSAIFQCLDGKKIDEVHKIIITASGGPFWNRDPATFSQITREEALSHPNWSMGKKITVDSSTLMNKGLEVIEASYLFQLPPEKIEVVIHPQSLVHSFVEWNDGSLFAQISVPDMQLPIQYALTYPERKISSISPLDFSTYSHWNFYPYDKKKFPCLDLAYQALVKKQSYPSFLNAANEVLVQRFLQQEISWMEIGEKLRQLISFHQGRDLVSLEAIRDVEREAKLLASST